MNPLKLAAAVTTAMTLSTAALAQPPAAPAQAPAPAASAPSPTRLNGDSTFKALLANPKSKALLYEQIPLIMDVFDMGLFPDTATLAIVAADPQAQSGGGFTAEVYARLLKDLAAL